jgi:hypothetical protein
MRQMASYTQQELKESGQEVEWLDTPSGVRILVDGIDLYRPGLCDWLFQGGLHFLAKKCKQLFTRKAQNRVFRIDTGESDWRRSGSYGLRH